MSLLITRSTLLGSSRPKQETLLLSNKFWRDFCFNDYVMGLNDDEVRYHKS
jgi:hypothetical protein